MSTPDNNTNYASTDRVARVEMATAQAIRLIGQQSLDKIEAARKALKEERDANVARIDQQFTDIDSRLARMAELSMQNMNIAADMMDDYVLSARDVNMKTEDILGVLDRAPATPAVSTIVEIGKEVPKFLHHPLEGPSEPARRRIQSALDSILNGGKRDHQGDD